MAAFKDAIDRAACEELATAFGLDESFVETASSALPELELKARVAHVADALRAALAPGWARAAEQVRAGLPPLLTTTERLGYPMTWWPVVSVVERHGAHDPGVSLPLLRELTQVFSGEFAIRPLLRAHPDEAWAAVRAWAVDPNPHVRRLASEGTRPRLPWGGRLRHEPAVDVLDALVDDPELYVRRSVANHLGDLAKDEPELAVQLAGRWLAAPSAERRWVVRHGLRHLVKKGHHGALALQGFDAPRLDAVRFSAAPARVVFPGAVELVLEADLRRDQALVVDAVVHFVTARGATSAKTWKWSTKPHVAGRLRLSKRFTMRPVSTRRYYPGHHRVELQVNGRVLAETSFELVV